MREASRLIEHGLDALRRSPRAPRLRIPGHPQIGRTHGIHAEPITFGLKIANWYAENRRDIERFGHAARRWPSAKFPARWAIASHLGRRSKRKSAAARPRRRADCVAGDPARPPRAISVARWRFSRRRSKGSRLEIRHLQRTEVREAEEPFGGEQRGSSAMPHKRNPVSCEQIAAWRAWCAPMPSRPTKMSRSGTSGTFRTARSSASFCPTPRSSSITCSRNDGYRLRHASFPERMRRNWMRPRDSSFPVSSCRIWSSRECRTKKPTKRSRRTPWPRGNRKPAFATALPTIPHREISRCESSRAHIRTAVNCVTWMRFSPAFLARTRRANRVAKKRLGDSGFVAPILPAGFATSSTFHEKKRRQDALRSSG